MRRIFLAVAVGVATLAAQTPYNFQSRAPLLLDAGAKSLTITDSGTLAGGSQTAYFPVKDSTQRAVVWFSAVENAVRVGGNTACPDPCSISMDLDWGKIAGYYEIVDSTGASYTPPRLSSVFYTKPINPAATSAPFTIPVYIPGFGGNVKSFAFSVAGGQDVSNLRVFLWLFDTQRKKLSVALNSGAFKLLNVTDILSVNSNGSGTCTIKTKGTHGLTNGQLVQLNYFLNYGAVGMNGNFNATVTANNAFTVPCSLTSGEWNDKEAHAADLPPFIRGETPTGKTVSGTVFYSDEAKFFGGMDSNKTAFRLTVPIGPTELTAGATNTVKFMYNGVGGLNQWILDWNIIEPDVEIDQIVIAGGDPLHATARVKTGTHSYQVGDTIMIQNAPGPLWRFDGERVITSVPDNTHFTFLWGPDTDGFTEYAGVTQTPSSTPGDPYYTAPGTYVVRTPRDVAATPAQHMYAARCIVPKSSFVAWNPSNDRTTTGNSTNGGTLYNGTTIKTRNAYFNHAALAKCVDCHMEGGFVHKYGQWPADVIKFGAIQDGFTPFEAEDIVTYIKSNSLTPPKLSRPWNPLFQPGANLASVAPYDRLAGAGYKWRLNYDQDMPEWLVPGGAYAIWAANYNLDMITIPIPIEEPRWHQWFPPAHPLDIYATFGMDFTTKDAWVNYNSYKTTLKNASNKVAAWETDLDYFLRWRNPAYDIGLLRTDTGLSGYKNRPNAGYSCYQAPTMTCQFYHYLSLWWVNRTIELAQAIGGLQGSWDTIWADWLLSATGQTRNAAAAPYTNYQIYSNSFFDTGPHKANIGDHCFHFQYGGNFTCANTNLDTAMWYMTQAAIGGGNRLGGDDNPVDWPYFYAFQISLSAYRPMFWMHAYPNAIAPRESWGLNTLNDMTSHWLTARFTLEGIGQSGIDQFATDAEMAGFAGLWATQFLELKSRFNSSSTWASKFPCTSPVNVVAGYMGSGLQFCDDFAAALPILQYFSTGYGTPTASQLTQITDWAQTVWPSPGGVSHNWAHDLTYACSRNWASIGISQSCNGPCFLRCTNQQ